MNMGESNLGLFDVLGFLGCCLHEGLVVEQFESVHFLSVFEVLLVLHLRQQHFFVLLVNALQVFLLVFFVLDEGTGVLLPHLSLLFVDFLLLLLLAVFLVDLPRQVLSHLLLLFLSDAVTAFFLFSFLAELVFDVFHHLFVFGPDLFFLVLDDRVGEGSHHCLDLLFSLLLLLFPLALELVLEARVFFLSLDVLNEDGCTSMRYLSAYSFKRRWLSSFSTMTCWNLCSSLSFLSFISFSSIEIYSLIF